MQQPYETSTSCYTPFLRAGDGDALFNPFAGATTISKYNGNAKFLAGQNVSASQEVPVLDPWPDGQFFSECVVDCMYLVLMLV